MAVNVLAMDGGGGLSLFSLFAIQRILLERPAFLKDVDVFSGTSAGGINSLIMVASKDREEGLRTSVTLWSSTPPTTSAARRLLAVGGCRAVSGNEYLKDFLEPILGYLTLGDLAQKGERLVIPAFKVCGESKEGKLTWKPKVFHNFGDETEPDLKQLAIDVALRTSAAPIFLPIFEGFADGGLFANNPSMCALSQVLSTMFEAGDPEAFKDIRLLSVGTGLESSFLPVKNADWGWQQWLLNPRRPLALVEAFFEAGMMAVDYQCRTLLKNHFYRLNPPLRVGADQASFNLEDAHKRPGDPDFSAIRDHLQQVAGVDDPATTPPWLEEVLQWIDEVGWMKETAKPASGEAKPKRAGGGARKTTAKS